ncbi:MAG: TldD/PmbA family protein [Myxococcaceae bacterium]|jgi:TldD protein|nr:TldD/PmbA family protein [Myxococcaceae bacterium]
MSFSRRQFLTSTGLTAASVLAGRAGLAEARGLVLDATLLAVVDAALSTARAGGATYADVRVHRRREETVSVRDDHPAGTSDTERYGVGVRVLKDGAWGFASTSRVDAREVQQVTRRALAIAIAQAPLRLRPVELAPTPAHVDVWQTPLEKDPFKIPVADKLELLLAISQTLRRQKVPSFSECTLSSRLEWKLFASTEGALIEQAITRLGPSYAVTLVKDGDFVQRAWDGQAMQAGWEYLAASRFVEDAEQVAEDVREKLAAAPVEPGRRDLILSPENLWLTIHESVGHPTELDRALGDEANFAGTSFATPDKLNRLQYGAPAVTLYADKTTPGGLATCGYDDDGVKTGRWNLVEQGRFVGYQTTREQAGWIGERASRGCAYAQDHASVPFQRMPNVSLAPSATTLGVKDLIAATDDGVYVRGDGSWSIDHQRYNFQFTGQMFYEVKKGKVTRALRDVAYQSNTLEFWSACDLIGGPSEWRLGSAFDDGKGEPVQSNPVSHGCPPTRFKKISVLNTRAKKGA